MKKQSNTHTLVVKAVAVFFRDGDLDIIIISGNPLWSAVRYLKSCKDGKVRICERTQVRMPRRKDGEAYLNVKPL